MALDVSVAEEALAAHILRGAERRLRHVPTWTRHTVRGAATALTCQAKNLDHAVDAMRLRRYSAVSTWTSNPKVQVQCFGRLPRSIKSLVRQGLRYIFRERTGTPTLPQD